MAEERWCDISIPVLICLIIYIETKAINNQQPTEKIILLYLQSLSIQFNIRIESDTGHGTQS